jgi:hypothetical protein
MTAPKAKRAPAKSALQKLQLIGAYHATALLANIFGSPFWFFEQHRWRLADRLDKERGARSAGLCKISCHAFMRDGAAKAGSQSARRTMTMNQASG